MLRGCVCGYAGIGPLSYHRPLVVRDTSEIEIVVKTGEDEAYLSLDGQIACQ